MMGNPDPDIEPEWEEWMDAPLLERLSPYRYFFAAGCLVVLLPIIVVILLAITIGCGAPGAPASAIRSFLP
jgi:hypothetical protein